MSTTFASANTIAETASLLGDVSRAQILLALMDGRALTAGELAASAGVSAATASGHLARLVEGELLKVVRQGRSRYFSLAGPQVAHFVEELMALVSVGPGRYRPTGPKDVAMRQARTCYDHLAGRLAVDFLDRMIAHERLAWSDETVVVTGEGHRFLCDFGIDLEAGGASKRPLCRTCLDWSERRPHLSGRLGSAFLDRFLALDWIARVPESRAVRITGAGRLQFRDRFDIEIA